VVRVTGANMRRGLPACPCGQPLEPSHPGDRVELGLLDLDELPRRVRTELCREMGWEDMIVRTSPAQQRGSRRIRTRRKRTLKEMPF